MYRAKPPSPVWAPGKLNPANPGKGRSPIAGFCFMRSFCALRHPAQAGRVAWGFFVI